MKRCFRCGSDNTGVGDHLDLYFPVCCSCRARGPYFITRDEAIEWWNDDVKKDAIEK